MDLSRLDLDSFRGRRIGVLGMARTGVALCRFLVDRGATVTAYDGRTATELADQILALEGRPVQLMLGPAADPALAIYGKSMICTSPAISSRYSTTEPRLRAVLQVVEQAGQIPIISEVDLFLRLSPGTSIGVTGTKGKTTTAHLVAALLGESERPVLLGGNTGTPLIEKLPELRSDHIVVLELSELQLPTMSRGTDVAVYTNVTVDHIDRHRTVGAYRTVKRRLAELASPDGHLVLNADDPISSRYASSSRAAPMFYTRSDPLRGQLGVRDGWIYANMLASHDGCVMPVKEIGLRGAHNVSNVLAAVLVGLMFGVDVDRIGHAVGSFEGLENRLEVVRRIGPVVFVNDTQATQQDAVVAALRSFAPPVVLIAGGQSKGLPLGHMAREAASRAFATVLIGETGPRLARLLKAAGAPAVEEASDMEEAVRRAYALACEALAATSSKEATVLLSPGAAGYQLLAPHSVRGAEFKHAVHSLARQLSMSESRTISE